MKFFLNLLLANTLSISTLAMAESMLGNRHISLDDFVWTTIFDESQFLKKSHLTNCRNGIKDIMCLVDKIENIEKGPWTCLEGGDKYAHHFEGIYDAYPPAMQKMFCSLKVIYIAKEFYGTAFAGLLETEDGKILGAQMGIRKSVLDESLDLHTWASWKEQIMFGGIADSYELTPDLPTMLTKNEKPRVNDFLYFVVSHEFGHIFDFSNRLNNFDHCSDSNNPDEKPVCFPSSNSWGAINWQTNTKPLPENDFPHRDDLCFYHCKDELIDKNLIPSIYRDLYENSSFISAFATLDPWQDFADSLAYFLMAQNLGASYILDTKQGQTYDVMGKLKSDKFRNQKDYLEHFLNRTDIFYP